MTDFKELRGAPLVEAVLQGDLVAELKMQAIVFQKSGAERMALLLNRALDRLEAAERDARRPYIRAELPPLPEWALRDDLGGLVPSEIRAAMRVYARAAVTSHEAAIAAAMKEQQP